MSSQTCRKCSTFLGSKICQSDVPQSFQGEKDPVFNALWQIYVRKIATEAINDVFDDDLEFVSWFTEITKWNQR